VIVLLLLAGTTLTTGCNLFGLFDSPDNAFNTIGRGYDFFSQYAVPSEVKDSRILNLEALNSDDLLDRRDIDEGKTEVISGESLDTYLTNMSADISVEGSYKGFTGSVSASFNESTYREYGRSFATVRSVVRKEKLFIDSSYNADDLKPYLDDRFREQINDSDTSPAEIFGSYGTHAITSIFTGGRLEYNATAETSLVEAARDFGAQAKAGFDVKFLSVDAEAAFSSSSERSNYESHAETTVQVYPAAQSSIDIATAQDYQEWQEAVKASEENLLSAFGEGGLIGVWNFADNQDRRDELLAGFEAWARKAEDDLGLGAFGDDTFTVSFNAYGGWPNVEGDADMDIDGGGPFSDDDNVGVNASVAVDLGADDELVLTLSFDIAEDGGDGTRFKGTQTLVKTYSGPGTLVGVRGNTSCSLTDEATPGAGRTGSFPSSQCSLGTINWRADQDGSDAGYVGISGTLNVPVVLRTE